MTANPILLQKKHAKVIAEFAKMQGISAAKAMDFYYKSDLYHNVSEGVSDMHCMSEEYLAKELQDELERKI